MKLNTFYTDLLESFGYTVDTKTGVVQKADGTPLKTNGDAVVLPVDSLLDAGDWTGKLPFHPGCEDILSGQSRTIHLLQRLVANRLTTLTAACAMAIIEIAGNPDCHSTLANPEAHTHLACAKNPTKNALKALRSILTMYGKKDAPLKMFNVHLSRNQNVDGATYLRWCSVHVPIIEDTDENAVLQTVDVRSKNDKKTIRKTFEYILGDKYVQSPGVFGYGYTGHAPYLHCLLTMYGHFISRIDAIMQTFGTLVDWKPINLRWIKHLDNIEKMSAEIPPLPGNAGATMSKSSIEVEPPSDVDTPAPRPERAVRRAAPDSDTPPWTDDGGPTEPPVPPVQHKTGLTLDKLVSLRGGRDSDDSYDDERDYRRDRYDRDRRRDYDDVRERRRDYDDDRDYRRSRYRDDDQDDRYDRHDRDRRDRGGVDIHGKRRDRVISLNDVIGRRR